VLAYTLVDALAGEAGQYDIFRFAAGGFRDFTRIASSDPQMWHDIALANRDAILNSIDLFTAHLAQIRSAIEQQDGKSLLQTFQRAKQARDHFAAMLASNTTKNLEP
jgi:prephenate dehydrogenase